MNSLRNAVSRHIVAESMSELPIPPESACIWSGVDDVHRHAVTFWRSRARDYPERTVQVIRQRCFDITVSNGGSGQQVELIDRVAMARLFEGARELVIDVTAIRTGVWYPILAVAREKEVAVRMVYVESAGYELKPDPVSWNWYDLTSSTQEFGPIPGLARLVPSRALEDAILVIMLGFEGVRTRRAIAGFDPTPKLIPIVGLPGNKLHFPHIAIASNCNLFRDYKCEVVRFAGASDPFAALEILREVRAAYSENFLYIAAIGSKPHQIGAVLFRMSDDHSDLIYDFPEPRHSAAVGIGRAHFYYL